MGKESLPWCVKCGIDKMRLIDDSEDPPKFKCPACGYEVKLEWEKH